MFRNIQCLSDWISRQDVIAITTPATILPCPMGSNANRVKEPKPVT